MNVARKIMETSSKTTESEKKMYADLLAKAPALSVNEAKIQYKTELDNLCKEFGAASVTELLIKADSSELPLDVASKVFRYTAFFERQAEH